MVLLQVLPLRCTAHPLKWSAPEDGAECRTKLSRGLHLKLIFQGRIMAISPFLFKSPQTELRGVSLFQKTGRSKSKLMYNRTKKMPLQSLASMVTRGFNHGPENPLALYEYLSHRSCSLAVSISLSVIGHYSSHYFCKPHSNHQDNRKLYCLKHMLCLILFLN